MCQDRGAGELPWVDRTGTGKRGELRVSPAEPAAGRVHSGTVTAYVPDIGGLLPVYVYDRYEGFEVKTFAELTDEELDAYIAANVAAATATSSAAGGVDAALANHLVMGPLILARGGLRFAAKIHGSALEFTVRPNPRFLPHAAEGIEGRGGGPRRVAAHGGEPVGDAGGARPAGEDAPRAARGRHRAVRARDRRPRPSPRCAPGSRPSSSPAGPASGAGTATGRLGARELGRCRGPPGGRSSAS